MLNRQKSVLHMLGDIGGQASRLQITQLCFLLQNESPCGGGSTFYRFVPYLYGPFSFTLYRELGSLVRHGMLEEHTPRGFRLTDFGLQSVAGLPEALRRDVACIVKQYGGVPLHELVRHAYDKYPWFTVNSRSVGSRGRARPVGEPAVYTVGYEGLLVDEFLDRLMREGIRRVIDVRSNPVSRVYGFHKSTLSRLCKRLGVGYSHYPQLGIPSADRRDLRSRADYSALLRRYEQETLPRRTRAVEMAAELLKDQVSVLMCAEADPSRCHRSKLAKVAAALTHLPVRHLAWHR